MKHTLLLEEFLKNQKINQEQFDSTKLDWGILNAIAEHHLSNSTLLTSIAEYCAKVTHIHPKVHSIRWRVKDADHLKAKIIRKVLDKNEKYTDITIENYQEKITDLIGIRILHLYKYDIDDLLKHLQSHWKPIENPVAYIRNDDNVDVYKSCGIETKVHKSGYRSVHYIFSSSPTNQSINVEIQIRTIFEEGWSEIDHNLRYPNYQPSSLTEYFLKIFNRLAGSADEMGSFVTQLEREILDKKEEIHKAQNESIESQQKIDTLLSQLEHAKDTTAEHRRLISSLKSQINNQNSKNNEPYQYFIKNTSIDSDSLKEEYLKEIFSDIFNTNLKNKFKK